MLLWFFVICAIILVLGWLLQFALMLIPNIIWVVISIGVVLCCLAALVGTAVLLVRLIIKVLRKESTLEMKKAVKHFLLAVIVTVVLILVNNHVMPVIGEWIQNLSVKLVGG